jgi:hypothetical protein
VSVPTNHCAAEQLLGGGGIGGEFPGTNGGVGLVLPIKMLTSLFSVFGKYLLCVLVMYGCDAEPIA